MRIYKSNRGMSLLETALAMTLLAVIIFPLFGLLFSHTAVTEHLNVQGDMRATAKDVKSFIKLSNYDTIFNFAKNSEFFEVEEVNEGDLVSRKFVKYSPHENHKPSKLLVQFELTEKAWADPLISDVSNSCSIPLRCKIYHLKHVVPNTDVKKLLKSCDSQLTTYFAKTR